MKFLHTADWHIGQLFYEHDRTVEHEQFLIWLIKTLREHQIDVLLISGDVFDHANPSVASIKLWYSFLNTATRQNPELRIIITAGNHDSATRLEAPKPLLESSKISIVGTIEKNEFGNPNYERVVIPIRNKNDEIEAFCLAIPFLRQGDYPNINEAKNPYTEGIVTFYQEVVSYVKERNPDKKPLIVLGHLTVTSAEITDLDSHERSIMGGMESVPLSAFADDITYVALGHIHKAQSIAGKQHIRYSGSPIPLSFSELTYKHQVVVFQLDQKEITSMEFLEVPEIIPLLRIPQQHESLSSVLSKLELLPNTNENTEYKPYLEVRVLLEGPEPGLRHKIETALEGKHVTLTRIDVAYPKKGDLESESEEQHLSEWTEIKPEQLLKQAYFKKYQQDVPDILMTLFREAVASVSMEDER